MYGTGAIRQRGMITESIASVVPIIPGGGIPHLSPVDPAEKLHLESSRSHTSVIVRLRYTHSHGGKAHSLVRSRYSFQQ
jgi:hypothetical protein